ncbi:hypothetical protein [Nocardia kruczakiae]|uniref:hypothetical protein n=1 Tax=Nocardia kruczakiae TaxID=261477 RepID=UPI0012EDCCBE|nr:hypothetical protein [Nocardia kruczakiae]
MAPEPTAADPVGAAPGPTGGAAGRAGSAGIVLPAGSLDGCIAAPAAEPAGAGAFAAIEVEAGDVEAGDVEAPESPVGAGPG